MVCAVSAPVLKPFSQFVHKGENSSRADENLVQPEAQDTAQDERYLRTIVVSNKFSGF